MNDARETDKALSGLRNRITESLSPSEEDSSLLVELERRCKASEIEYEQSTEGRSRRVVKLRAGRSKRELTIWDNSSAESLLNIPFEKIHGLMGYRAYCSYEADFIEAAIEFGRRIGPSRFAFDSLMKRLGRAGLGESDPSKVARMRVEHDDEQPHRVVLTIGPATNEFGVLDTLAGHGRPFSSEKVFVPTIRIEGLSISQHDQATRLLERIANAVFFHIDLLTDTPIYLAVEGDRTGRRRRAPAIERNEGPTFPKYEYDTKPMSLYWYASSAREMPLLQYLAYYQVIEYFFPQFTEKATYDILKRMLKDPTCHRDPDAHIGHFLGALKPLLGNGGHGEEKRALLETIRNCVTDSELRVFFSEDPERVNFYRSESNKIAPERITLESKAADIITETANRVYEIRCKIVHTKSGETGGSKGQILPSSSEAQMLGFDIELVRFLARKVLIATANPLTL